MRINAIEPGFTPNTGLGRDANAFLRFLANSDPKFQDRVVAETRALLSDDSNV
ncbi:MAG TPA: hypothetical protein VGY48_16805 [Vicinamibacterales bacterium]|nr:hypothetical protein [Vicinamibacterales bacterium]